MKLIVDNLKTKAVVGGSDNLLDFDLMETLRDYLKVRPKGYNYSPKYKKHVWDGYIRFISPKGEFATGFLPLVCNYLRDLGVEIVIVDLRENIPVLKKERTNVVGTVDGVDWIAEGKFQYQFDAINTVDKYVEGIYFPRGILDFATNAGKNSVATLFFKNIEMPDGSPCSWIFMVSSELIYKQAVEFFQQCIPDEEIGEINSRKYNPKRITVCMVKTLLSKAKSSINVVAWMGSINGLIVDESDEAGAKDYSKCLSYINAPMKIFVSGTPLDSTKVQNNMTSIGLSGPVMRKITNAELMELGVSQKVNVIILLNRTTTLPFDSYDTELNKNIHTSENRVQKIIEVIEKHKGEKILITFFDINHGYFMYERIKAHYESVAIIHGPNKNFKCNRDEDLERFKSGDLEILLSSMIIKRGVNANAMRVLIRAEEGKSKTTTKQIAGRAARHDGKNDTVTLYDFYDDSKILSKHSRDRIKVYKDEGFEVTYTFETKRGKPV